MEEIHENGGHKDERESRQERWKEIDNAQEIVEEGLDNYLDELATYYSDYEPQSGEFTVNQIIELANDSADRSRITADLHRRVKSGELGEKKVRIDGCQQWLFWRIKNPAD